MSACKLKRLHLCGSAPWQKAWVRPSLRGVIDGRVAVVTRCKQEQAVSLFAAWWLFLRRAIVTPDVLLMMNREQGGCLLDGNKRDRDICARDAYLNHEPNIRCSIFFLIN